MESKIKIKGGLRFFIFFASTFLGLSNIYWLPIIGDIRVISVTLFILTCSTLFFIKLKKNQIYLPNRYYGVFGMTVLFILFIPSILLSNNELPFKILLDFINFYIFLWIIYIIANKSEKAIIKITSNATKVILFFCALHIIESTFTIYNISPTHSSLSQYTGFKETGFNLSRTGWSNGICLFIPCIFLVFKNDFFKIIGILVILYSQFLCGGRSGLIASIYMILALIKLQKTISNYKIFFLLGLILIFGALNIDLIISSLRFDRLDNQQITFNTLNYFSANRLIGYQYGLEIWVNNPFTGKGIGNVDLSSISNVKDIHNFWVKTLAESGILTCLFLLAFISYPIRIGLKYINRFKNEVTIYFFIIVSGGALLTLFEPNVIFNSFKNSSIWWFSLAVMLSKIKQFNRVK